MTNVDAQPTTALVPIKVVPQTALLPSMDDLKIIKTLSETAMMAKSMLPTAVKSQADAAAIMLSGLELGVRPFTALRHIFLVNGKPEPDAQIMAGVVQGKEPDATIEVVELTDALCTMRITRPSRGLKGEYTYYLEDARKAGLISPNNPWGKYPKDMMRWAATKRLCRIYAPDLINAVEYLGGGEVATAMETVQIEQGPAIDVSALPQEALYSEGDDPAEETPTASEGDFREVPEDDEATPPAAEEAPANVMEQIVGALKRAGRRSPQAASILTALGLERITDLNPVITPETAAEICLAVWDYDPGVPMEQAASRTHAQRALEGKPFVRAAILTEDVTASVAHALGETPAQPRPESPPAPAGRANMPPPPRRPRDAGEQRRME